MGDQCRNVSANGFMTKVLKGYIPPRDVASHKLVTCPSRSHLNILREDHFLLFVHYDYKHVEII